MNNLDSIKHLINDPKEMFSIKEVKIVNDFIFILNVEGKILVCGENNNGLLGNPNKEKVIALNYVNGIPKISKIACGKNFILALDIYNKVWGWGNNIKGQLGVEENGIIYIPTQIDIGNVNIVDISVGEDFSFLVTEKGHVYSCGNNDYGQLGLGHNKNINKFTRIDEIISIKKVSCGNKHVCILSEFNKVFTCGKNTNGQLGIYNNVSINKFKRIDKLFDIVGIECGNNHTVLLRKDGYLFATGINTLNQLGLKDNNDRNFFTKIKELSNVKDFKVYKDYTLAIKTNNEIFSFGYNELEKALDMQQCVI